ncbi:MFS transporter [Streptomyces sp. NPDC050610]|uniref:MFS transporter n=1 Tax=Streptomyces sp. NPDC050610 TaxID=3157097 RepID=UPI0034363DB8
MNAAPSTTAPTLTRSAVIAAAGIVLIALNLRLGISSAAALLDRLRADPGLGPLAAALLPALPTLAFAAAGAGTATLARRLGAERTVLLALAALTAGLAVRAAPATWALLAGTVLGTSGLALCNVLLPTLLRARFPSRVALLTGVYTTTMALGSTLGAAVAIPVADAVGSPSLGLAVWALPALAATAVWSFVRPPEARGAAGGAAAGERVSPLAMARTRLGALVTAYFALQALNCYAVIGWLPSLLSDHGMSGGAAGGMLAVTQAVGIPATFAVLAFARAPGRLRTAFVAISAAMLAGFAGLLTAPVALPLLWAVLVGLGLCSFPLVLAVIGDSGSTPAETTALSTLSQSLGYLVAALGPFAVGLLHSASGGWTVPMAALLATAAAQLAVGVALSGTGIRKEPAADA